MLGSTLSNPKPTSPMFAVIEADFSILSQINDTSKNQSEKCDQGQDYDTGIEGEDDILVDDLSEQKSQAPFDPSKADWIPLQSGGYVSNATDEHFYCRGLYDCIYYTGIIKNGVFVRYCTKTGGDPWDEKLKRCPIDNWYIYQDGPCLEMLITGPGLSSNKFRKRTKLRK